MAVATLTTPEVIRPQPGPQTAFLASPADIVIYGGSAFGGKTYGLLLEATRHVGRPDYRGVIFRRTNPQIMAGGGLWDAASKIYPRVGGVPNLSAKEWRFPSGARIAFRHLQHETDIYDWQGAELAFQGWDELTHFSERQFVYLLSRLRTTCGVRPSARATCNPDAGSWVKTFIAWWLDLQTGYPLPERAGVLRWFYRINDELEWYDSRAAAEDAHPDLAADAAPLSVTFIPAKMSDNAIGCARDPGYRAKLKALSWVERARLEDGNWNATASDGMFRQEWFPPPVKAEDLPKLWKKKVRAWDFAATEPKDQNDPDWLVGTLMGKDEADRFWVLDVKRYRISPLKVKNTVRQTAIEDGPEVEVVVEQEPAAAGKVLAHEIRALLSAKTDEQGRPQETFRVYIMPVNRTTGDKVTRAYPFSAACEQGKVWVVAAPWNKAWFGELVQFPAKGVHDDQVDSGTTAHRGLTRPPAVAVA